jgi:hypothetical protein
MTVRATWKRWGNWAAHLFDGDKQLCPTRHGVYRGLTHGPTPPALVESLPLSDHGIPYGKVCAHCLRIFRQRDGAG